MESLANEKMTLELKLANEKRDAVNEKENLSDELKSALEGKHKAQSMYEVGHVVAVRAVDSVCVVGVSSSTARL